MLTKEAKARLVFRPYTTAPLGVVGCATTQGTLAPGWFLAGVPLWGEDDLTSWANERGFTEVTAMRRHAKKAWLFRARLPDGLNLGNNPWSFKSGITVSPAKSQASRKTSKPERLLALLGVPRVALSWPQSLPLMILLPGNWVWMMAQLRLKLTLRDAPNRAFLLLVLAQRRSAVRKKTVLLRVRLPVTLR